MRIEIHFPELSVPDGYYGTTSEVDEDGTLHLTIDPFVDPDECSYPVAVGYFS